MADENCSEALLDSLPAHVEVLTNRWGLYQYALGRGLIVHFNDFDFSVLTSPRTIIYYRISKEKAVTNHVIKNSFELLSAGGQLILWGEKKAGIKTYVKKANVLFSDTASARKSGADYVATLTKTAELSAPLPQVVDLDDSDYARLRAEALFVNQSTNSDMLWTKPGLFGWNKIDRGSALLIAHLDKFFARFSSRPETLLDLGCGYGLLSAAAASWGIAHITAVDNCAAALLACKKNMDESCRDLYDASLTYSAANEKNIKPFNSQVVGADCRDAYREDFERKITQKFDAVLCNPPFHQGFDTERELTQAFLKTAARQLEAGGQALFVTNRFIALEKTAKLFFKEVEILAENGEFRVTVMTGIKQ